MVLVLFSEKKLFFLTENTPETKSEKNEKMLHAPPLSNGLGLGLVQGLGFLRP